MPGWAWLVRARSSEVAANSIANTASWMRSPARGPMMCTPRRRSVRAQAITFTMPSVSPVARLLELAVKGNFPTA